MEADSSRTYLSVSTDTAFVGRLVGLETGSANLTVVAVAHLKHGVAPAI